jgi:excisionase family DNA binding protein
MQVLSVSLQLGKLRRSTTLHPHTSPLLLEAIENGQKSHADRKKRFATDFTERLKAVCGDITSGLEQEYRNCYRKGVPMVVARAKAISTEIAPGALKASVPNTSTNGEFEPLVDSYEAAKLLGVHPKTLQHMARRGLIPAIRVGKLWRFRISALDFWIRAAVNSSHGCAYRETQESET